MSGLKGIEESGLVGEVWRFLREAGCEGLIDPAELSPALEKLAFCSTEEDGSFGALVQWLDDEKAHNYVFQKREGLRALCEWSVNRNGHLVHKERKFFRVIGMEVISPHREVPSWSQPILDNAGTGIIGLLIKKRKDRTYFLMQAKVDAGNRGIVQIGPTVQFNPGNYSENRKLRKPFLFDEFCGPGGFIKVMESRQSEEGGRFYKEDHVHKVLMLPDDAELDIPPEYRWFSYSQIRFFLHMGEFVNSCARSILSCLV